MQRGRRRDIRVLSYLLLGDINGKQNKQQLEGKKESQESD
jgi:hypothetical protein